jgi:ABC-type phosphate transport system ATPase subunit
MYWCARSDRSGEMMEHSRTEALFLNPKHPKTAEYIEGRYG